MAGPYVTAQGLEIKTIEEILSELSARQKADIDATLNTNADSPQGQLNGVFAAQLREVWEVLQVAYNAFNPDAAEGFLLEKLSALTGTLKEGATKSLVSLDCNLDPAVVLLAGVHFAHVVGKPDIRFTPKNDFTAVHVVPGTYSVPFEAENPGSIIANAGTITVISTALVGWNSVTNPADATPGKEIDTDPELRLRREEELRATGSATIDAIRADLLEHEEVLQADVFENTSNVIDSNGLPPRSIEAVVFDGTPPTMDNNDIAQIIWDSKAGGTKTVGFESGVAEDKIGGLHVVYFSRPTEREVWVEIDISINSTSGYAGESALKDALVLLNTTDLRLGRDVIKQKLSQVAMAFPGIFDVTEIRLGFTASPVGTVNLSIAPREIARLDTSRITVTETLAVVP